MPTYDCVDDAVIDATPSEIIPAFADEYAGRTPWWTPTFRAPGARGRRVAGSQMRAGDGGQHEAGGSRSA